MDDENKTPTERHEWCAELVALAIEDRDNYRAVRQLAWDLVVAQSLDNIKEAN